MIRRRTGHARCDCRIDRDPTLEPEHEPVFAAAIPVEQSHERIGAGGHRATRPQDLPGTR